MSTVTGAVSLISIAALAQHIWRSSFSSNLRAIRAWVREMDIFAHQQRYQGPRTDVLHTFYEHKTSFNTVTAKYLCRTKSGRFFDLEVTSDRSEVIRWTVDRVSPQDGALALSILAEAKADAGEPGTTESPHA